MAEDREVQTTVSPRDERAYRFIQYAVESRIAYVTIDRPGVLGHLHAEANEEMADIFARFRDDDAAGLLRRKRPQGHRRSRCCGGVRAW